MKKLIPEKRFVPDAYINTIKYRVPRRASILVNSPIVDKGQNLERLGRHLKLFTDRVNHEGAITTILVSSQISTEASSTVIEPGFGIRKEPDRT